LAVLFYIQSHCDEKGDFIGTIEERNKIREELKRQVDESDLPRGEAASQAGTYTPRSKPRGKKASAGSPFSTSPSPTTSPYFSGTPSPSKSPPKKTTTTKKESFKSK